MTAEIQFETNGTPQQEAPRLRVVETVEGETVTELLGAVATQDAVTQSDIPLRTCVEWARINPAKRF